MGNSPLPDPAAGLSFPLVLRDQALVRIFTGLLLALSAFVVLPSLVARALLGLTWLLRGQPADFAAYFAQATSYELPEGIAATHLGLASLLVVVALLFRYWHQLPTSFSVSVQPGWRWRFLFIVLVVAFVVLNGVLWLSAIWDPISLTEGQAGWPLLLLLVAVTSPLQAAAEEFFFRGYLLQTVSSAAKNAWVGIIATAALFALLHGVQNPALFVDRFAFGLLAGWLVLATGGLEAGIAAHVANNLLAYCYGLFTGGVAALKATTEVTWYKAVFDITGFALVALLAWRLGRRLNVSTTSA